MKEHLVDLLGLFYQSFYIWHNIYWKSEHKYHLCQEITVYILSAAGRFGSKIL